MNEKLKSKFDRIRILLEKEYKMDMNTVEKITAGFFSEGSLPDWYLNCKSAEEISRHLFIMTQLMNANDEHLAEVSDDGKEITYFINVGRDIPGKLNALLEENRGIDFVSFDSIKLQSGIRIVSIVKKNDASRILNRDNESARQALLASVREQASSKGYKNSEGFLKCLNSDYLEEELSSDSENPRIFRHQALYEQVFENGPICFQEDLSRSHSACNSSALEEVRVSIACRGCDSRFPLEILKILKALDLNLSRSYFDLLDSDGPEGSFGVLSVYFRKGTDITALLLALKNMEWMKSSVKEELGELQTALERIVRTLSRNDLNEKELTNIIEELKNLIRKNKDVSDRKEAGNYLLNSFSDFFEALEYLGLDDNTGVIKTLMGYDAFDEFWVETKHNGVLTNTEGFRTKHNSVRGTNKGGIRNDMIVEFSEVAALSFMMTWKCARSKILFGGGKGGLKINPRDYKNDKIDFFDTLSNFGRALFLVTGPSKDVPAGDVGCGAKEIGHMFEGFKSALHDIALIANGMKRTSAFMGNKVVSLEQAREILKNHFNIDYQDSRLLNELVQNEEYLELVSAPQITGKPKMGIQARTGATGRGLCYAILTTVANLYRSGKWDAVEGMSDEEEMLLQIFTGITEAVVLEKGGIDIISENQWDLLCDSIFPKLLRRKKVLVQGSGKVGSSVMEELSRFGISICGVADKDGAIYGDALDLDELLDQAKNTGTVINCRKNVIRKAEGSSGSLELLEQDCDILVLAALENTITIDNAEKIRASVIACGSNGPNTSKAELLLKDSPVTVIYDFLANGAGVTASYFEWLRNLTERFRYEAEVVKKEAFDIDIMDGYIMPEYRDRIKGILSSPESDDITRQWNLILRDIIVSALNEDYSAAENAGISMKTAGFVNSQLRVLAATLVKLPPSERQKLWNTLSEKARDELLPFLTHPEAELYNEDSESIRKELYSYSYS